MCLGVPGLVIERNSASDDLEYATVEFAGVRRAVCIALVPDVQPGEYVIVHAGVALNRIDAEAAERVYEYLNQIAELENEIRG